MLQLPVLQSRQDPPPDCFARFWDPKSPECAGGADPLFTHPRTGTHVRERCHFFQACGAKLHASQAAQQVQQRVVPLSSYSFPAVVQATKPMVSGGASRSQVPPMSQPMGPQAMQPQQVMQPMMTHGQWHPAPTYQFHHGIPNYLSMPEPHLMGESIWRVLLRELVRGVIKSFGHTLSYFVDTVPIRKQPPPPPAE